MAAVYYSGYLAARPLSSSVMRQITSLIALALLLAPFQGQAASTVISKEHATRIALQAAGCKRSADCVVRGRFERDRWVFVVSYVTGHNAKGEPMFTPGAWTGVTIGANGEVIETVPGA